MLHLLHEVICRLLLVMGSSSLLELLLPEGGSRSLIRLVMGLTVVAVLLEALPELK